MDPESVERRLAAILSADVVGYSRLMADDETATILTLADYREEIAVLVRQHRGRVVDTAGDSLLAEFPTALDAVRGSVEIQGVVNSRNATLPRERRMEFRIGVHLGDLAVESERIYGDGVNIAARLQALAEPGGICISETVHQQVKHKLDLAFKDLGEKEVKNIPDAVRVFRVRLDHSEAKSPVPAARAWRRVKIAAASLAALLLLAAAGIWLSWPAPLGLILNVAGLGWLPANPPLPDEPSVVVLPFVNLSDDPEQEYLADGLTEDVTSDLAGIRWVFVISRSSAYTYKGSAVNVAEVSRELGVRYVVEGSVRKVGERVRVTAQLIDATQDVHVWSERYDRDLGDLLDLQSEISEQILGALGVEIQQAEFERLRRKPTRSLSAYEAFIRGVGSMRKVTREDLAEARSLFEFAIEMDPEFAAAYASLVLSHSMELVVRCPVDLGFLPRARELTERALALDPFESTAYLALAILAFWEGEAADMLPAAERAVELAPSSDVAHNFLGAALVVSGRRLEAIGSFRRALRLSPRPPVYFVGMLGVTNYLAGLHDQGVQLCEQARAANPDVLPVRIWLAGHYERTGRPDKARAIAQEILRGNPDCTAERAAAFMGSTALDLEATRELRDQLLRAGLP